MIPTPCLARSFLLADEKTGNAVGRAIPASTVGRLRDGRERNVDVTRRTAPEGCGRPFQCRADAAIYEPDAAMRENSA